MKSSTAAPSFMNSGFDATAKGCAVSSAIHCLIRSAVPTGTVLLVTMILNESSAFAMSLAVALTNSRLAWPVGP